MFSTVTKASFTSSCLRSRKDGKSARSRAAYALLASIHNPPAFQQELDGIALDTRFDAELYERALRYADATEDFLEASSSACE